MRNYPIDKYKYYTYEKNGSNVIVAISTYAGKTVKGYAKCDPSDTYNFEKGKELAAARCAEKISLKREARAARKLAEAERALASAQAFYDKMLYYSQDAWQDVQDAATRIADIVNTL